MVERDALPLKRESFLSSGGERILAAAAAGEWRVEWGRKPLSYVISTPFGTPSSPRRRRISTLGRDSTKRKMFQSGNS